MRIWEAGCLIYTVCRDAGFVPITPASPMIWLFNRGLQQVDVEVRRAVDRDGYEIVLVTPDGTELVERVRHPRRLIKRTRRVQRRLMRRGWHPRSPLGMHPMPLGPPGTLARWAALLSSMRRSVRRRLAATFGF